MRFTRRRVLTILGAFAGAPLLGGDGRRQELLPTLYEWNGTALGSPARLMLCHPNPAAAERIVARCAAEIERLERIFALYREDSEVARLNREGRRGAIARFAARPVRMPATFRTDERRL